MDAWMKGCMGRGLEGGWQAVGIALPSCFGVFLVYMCVMFYLIGRIGMPGQCGVGDMVFRELMTTPTSAWGCFAWQFDEVMPLLEIFVR